LPRLITILPAIREARTVSDLDRLRTDIDAAVKTLAARAPEEERSAITALTLNYVNQVLAERQNLLLASSDRQGEKNLEEPEDDSVLVPFPDVGGTRLAQKLAAPAEGDCSEHQGRDL
jgi:hypothetical protein